MNDKKRTPQALTTIDPHDYFSGYNAGFVAGRFEGKNDGFQIGYEAGFEAMRKIAEETLKELRG